MKKLLLILALFLPALAFAQTGITTITASKINNAGTQPLTGQLCATPAEPFVAYGGGNVPATQVCYTVTNGVLQSGALLYDVSLSNPVNVCYQIVLKNSYGQTIQGYPCMQPSGPVYSFDNFVQANPPFTPTSFTIQPTLSFLGAWSSTQAYNPNNVVNYNGSSYVALLPNTNVTPVTGTTWALLAQQGNINNSTSSEIVAAMNTSPVSTTALLPALIPILNQNTTGTAANVTGIVASANGGTGVASPTGYAYANGASAYTFSTTIPYSSLTGTPTPLPTATAPGQFLASSGAGTTYGIATSAQIATALSATPQPITGTTLTANDDVIVNNPNAAPNSPNSLLLAQFANNAGAGTLSNGLTLYSGFDNLYAYAYNQYATAALFSINPSWSGSLASIYWGVECISNASPPDISNVGGCFSSNGANINVTQNGAIGNTAFNVSGTMSASVSMTTPIVNNTAAQTSVTCATSGTAVFSMPEQGASYKKVIVYENACIGAASYTFPTAFTYAPQVLSQAEAATATTVSATAVTVTGVASPGSTGFLELDGY